jgi:HSP20 family molecular chaperone IbpA
VAGFKPGDVEITLEENQLNIRGRQAEEKERLYLHRGIAARQFQRSFVLAEGIEVTGAEMDNGLLHIDLVRRKATPVVKRVAIRAAGQGKATSLGVSGKDD